MVEVPLVVEVVTQEADRAALVVAHQGRAQGVVVGAEVAETTTQELSSLPHQVEVTTLGTETSVHTAVPSTRHAERQSNAKNASLMAPA